MPKSPKLRRSTWLTKEDRPVVWIGTAAAFGLILSILFAVPERTTVAMTGVSPVSTVGASEAK